CLPGPQDHPGAAPGLAPAGAAHPHPRAAVLAGAAAGPRRPTPDRPDLAGPAGRLEQTTAPTPAQPELYVAAGITPPPRVTSLQPARTQSHRPRLLGHH